MNSKIIALIGFGLVLSASAGEIAHWNLDEGTATSFGQNGNDFYMDQSGNGNDLATWASAYAPTGSSDLPFATVPQTGVPNMGSLHFNGSADLYTRGGKPIDSYSFDAGWTIEASFKADYSHWGVIVGKDGNTGDGSPPFSMKFRGNDQKLEIRFWNSDTLASSHFASTCALNPGEWYSVAATFDGAIAKLYIKGTNDATYNLTGQLKVAGANLHPFDSIWTVGRGQWNGGNADNFNGLIDEVRISDRPLGTDEFLAVSAVPPPIGDVAMNFLNTNTLALTWATAERFNYALETTPDLLSGWSLGTNIAGKAGSVTVSTPVNQDQNFFRVSGGIAGSLMERAGTEPVLRYDANYPWRSIHIANAAILTPEESPDGQWRMYFRGSGFINNEYHDSIGIFTQSTNSFSPSGPWIPYAQNPILTHGSANSYDGKHLLDCAPVWAKGSPTDAFYMLYKAVSNSDAGSLAGASSADGGWSFTKFANNPLKTDAGPCDIVYHNNQYYIFYGGRQDPQGQPTDELKIYLDIRTDPEVPSGTAAQLAIDTGATGSFDCLSVFGGRIFKLQNRWYMVYQCSSVHLDYPNRFHVAWSDNLTDWTKVTHARPFFQRGEAGQWDEGAIWYGEVFEYEGMLYMYYEGWGTGQPGYDRDTPYAPATPPAAERSQIGLASVSVQAFLDWCGQ